MSVMLSSLVLHQSCNPNSGEASVNRFTSSASGTGVVTAHTHATFLWTVTGCSESYCIRFLSLVPMLFYDVFIMTFFTGYIYIYIYTYVCVHRIMWQGNYIML